MNGIYLRISVVINGYGS